MSLQAIDENENDNFGDLEIPDSEPPKQQKAKKQPAHHHKAQKSPRSAAPLAHPVSHTGRGKGTKGLGRGGAARHRNITKASINGITKPAIKRLARRGGTKRISGDVYDSVRGNIKEFLTGVLHDATVYTEHAGRKTVGVKQVVAALRNKGEIMYGFAIKQ